MKRPTPDMAKTKLTPKSSKPRTITLSENVAQEEPLSFMVFAHKSNDVDYMVFHEEREARDYAMEQEENASAPEDSWPIYALWASEWPIILEPKT